MLPHERTLYRKKSGTVSDRQAIASYVDKAFIVQSLDDNFNIRRAERFMVQILEEGIKPVLVLNKADLGFDRQGIEEQVKHLERRMPVFLQAFMNPSRFYGCGSPFRKGKQWCLSVPQASGKVPW